MKLSGSRWPIEGLSIDLVAKACKSYISLFEMWLCMSHCLGH